MRLEIEHDLSEEAAREKINGFLDQLSSTDLLAGVKLSNPKMVWTGNVMDLSFRLNKGFLRVNVDGTLTVTDKSVIIEINIPAIVTSFIPEKDIARRIESQARSLLNSL